MAVRNAAARPGTYPLIIFSHASGHHRRGAPFLCTHLSSHGWRQEDARRFLGGDTEAEFAARASTGWSIEPDAEDGSGDAPLIHRDATR